MRTYVFNRTKKDPLVVEHEGFIQMFGHKRGIRMQAPVLIEFNLKIKTGGEEEGDDQQALMVLPYSTTESQDMLE